MKKQFIKSLAIILISFSTLAAFESCKGKPKDADIQAEINRASTAYPGLSASFNDGVATLTGETTNATMKSGFEGVVKAVPGVESVVNNITVNDPMATAPPPGVNADDSLSRGIADATKDFPSVKATVNNGVITLTGELKRSQVPTLMQSLNTLKPKKIENNLTITQ